jgi:GrpB-like predicted nucleotidyltransferase (UPF0157 family)
MAGAMPGPDASPRIVVAEYDPRWPALFEAERALILGAVGGLLAAVEHVGSTAVPGLAAKPIIDIMLGLRSLADAPAVIAGMAGIGYEYVPDYENELPERRYFRKPGGPELAGSRRFHVHAVETTSQFWRRHLAFRDYLRAHPEACAEYAALKRRLAAEFGNDRRGYTEAKTEFITRIERLALGETAP